MRLFTCMLLACLIIPSITNAQFRNSIQKVGMLKDKDGYTFIREGAGTHTNILDTLKKTDFFIFYPNDSSDWSKVEKRFYQGIKTPGYIHRSRIVNIEELERHRQSMIIDSIFKVERNLHTKYNHQSEEYFSISDKFHMEQFYLTLSLFVSYFTKYQDQSLLNKYLDLLMIEYDSVDETPAYVLGLLFLQQPAMVIQAVKSKENDHLKDLLYFGFLSVTEEKGKVYERWQKVLYEL